MPPTEIRSKQIKDGQVMRSDLNITQTGEALIRRLIAGTNISFSSTGVDTGTGDVTVSVSSTPNFTTLSINGTQVFDSSRNLSNVGNIEITGELKLPNNKGLVVKSNSGTYRDVIKLDSTNVVQIGSTGLNTNIVFLNTGKVGIRTTTPSADLEVVGTNISLVANSTTATTNSYLGFQRSGTLKGVFGNSWAADNLINGSVQDDMCIRNGRDILFSCDSGTNLHARISTSGIMLKSGLTFGIGGVNGYSGTISFADKDSNLHELSFDGGILIGYSLN